MRDVLDKALLIFAAGIDRWSLCLGGLGSSQGGESACAKCTEGDHCKLCRNARLADIRRRKAKLCSIASCGLVPYNSIRVLTYNVGANLAAGNCVILNHLNELRTRRYVIAKV